MKNPRCSRRWELNTRAARPTSDHPRILRRVYAAGESFFALAAFVWATCVSRTRASRALSRRFGVDFRFVLFFDSGTRSLQDALVWRSILRRYIVDVLWAFLADVPLHESVNATYPEHAWRRDMGVHDRATQVGF